MAKPGPSFLFPCFTGFLAFRGQVTVSELQVPAWNLVCPQGKGLVKGKWRELPGLAKCLHPLVYEVGTQCQGPGKTQIFFLPTFIHYLPISA